MNGRQARAFLVFIAAAGSVATSIGPADARAHVRQTRSHDGVRFARGGAAGAMAHGGYQSLVSDGPGSGFGFHHLPYPLHVVAANARDRQAAAVRSAVITDAFTQGFNGYGFGRDSVYAQGQRGGYGVFNGADGYGSSYFAGYYGPGEGTDYGVFGHAYD